MINKKKEGSSSLIFKLNNLPKGGSCVVNPKNGTEMFTFFSVYCQNWVDTDGTIKKYEYYCSYKFFKIFYDAKIY